VEAIAVSLVLIALVVASSILARMSPLRLPIPFAQILLGAVAALAFDFRVELDAPTFLLFLAPCSFLTAGERPRRAFCAIRARSPPSLSVWCFSRFLAQALSSIR
jgi:CPA1 family monovalent cation:H+ antiporter